MKHEKDMDSAGNVETVNALVALLDGEDLARRCNDASGSRLLPESALTLARQVGLTALRTPGKPVTVAGINGLVEDGKLTLSVIGEVAAVECILPKEGL